MPSTFFTAANAMEEFHHDYLKRCVMKIELCPNKADERTESENNNSLDPNDGRGAVGAQASPVFGRSVSPISTSPPRFSDLASTLDGESDTFENCCCCRYCYCQVDE